MPHPPSLYLVTGGCGFIGSHLCEALLRAGHGVRVLDDLSSGRRENLPPGAALIEGDISHPATMRAALEGVAGCFHLAAIASVERGMQDWLGSHRTNQSGTITLFDAIRALAAPVPVVYASSAAVYGDAAALPIDEEAPKAPLSAYGADKYGCELHARVAGHAHGIPTLGLRFFNVYGPRQDPRAPYSGVISIFCDRLRRGEPVDLFGDGQQTRDFVFVEDVVAALLRAPTRATREAPVFNVCSGEPTSVRALATLIAGLNGRQPDFRPRPARLGEVRHSLGAPGRARAALGLGAPTPLSDGLAAVLAWLDAEASTAG